MRYFYLFILLIIASNAISQDQAYTIKGKVVGKYAVKNALFFDRQMKLLGKVPIKNQEFSFSGIYRETDSIGHWPLCYVYCANADTVTGADISLSRVIYFEPNVEVVFNSGSLKYSVSGGPLNEFENTFIAQGDFYNKKADSIQGVIDKTDIGEELKKLDKKIVRLRYMKIADSANLASVLKNTSSVVALSHFRLSSLIGGYSPGELREYFNMFSEKLRNSGGGKQINKSIAEMEKVTKTIYPTAPKLSKNDTMYDFSLSNVNDELIKSTNVFGKYTLIDFWATWCVPCREETPNLRQAFDKYSVLGFKIITISIDKEANDKLWRAVVDMDKMQKFVNLKDPKKTISEKLNIKAIPSNYLVDDKGKVVASNLRGAELEIKLKELFEE
ncbi:TlpA disulfide reductase family protein [Pedobacter foliorum]|uniref:TlpA family protein disulfide reductase n=1 Tax=Pedobacter foliorum TaxID=2739058 RepID=UPI0015662EBF|nr:TlpA disulfide reductase family protein [Pedobacter foliorum]NRF39877.1 TlpA family protein disulfide reductase [Pedobacter foliorum]